MPPAPKLKFTEGEKVLCFHGPLIYEAKCLKSSITKDKLIKYFVHYAGWSKNWDEWVPESRVLKFNETNVAKQKEVQRNHTAPAKGKKAKAKAKTDLNASKDSDSRASTPVLEPITERKAAKTKQPSTPSSSTVEQVQTPETTKKKRGKFENAIELDEVFVSKVDIKIKIPDELKQMLVDDWDIINKQRKLWPLPATTTVDEILENYVTSKKVSKTATSNNTNRDSVIIEVADGIREYFNALLNTQLLYKTERPQYFEVIEDNDDEELTQPSSVYGCIHLLRLFVRLGGNLSFTPLDDCNIQFLVEYIHDFLKYLIKNISSLFNIQDCYTPSQEYFKKVAS